jgi:RNA recognition motif-containing protein
VSNLAKIVKEDDLRERFGTFGAIENLRVVKDPFTQYKYINNIKGV